jgi:hypothetical protein
MVSAPLHDRSKPEEKPGIENAHLPRVFPHRFHHVLGATGAGATPAIPQADEVHPIGAMCQRGE